MRADGIITGRGNFRAESTNIQLDLLTLARSAESLPRVAYAALDPKWAGVVFAPSPSQQIYVNGLELGQGDLIVLGAARPRSVVEGDSPKSER